MQRIHQLFNTPFEKQFPFCPDLISFAAARPSVHCSARRRRAERRNSGSLLSPMGPFCPTPQWTCPQLPPAGEELPGFLSNAESLWEENVNFSSESGPLSSLLGTSEVGKKTLAGKERAERAVDREHQKLPGLESVLAHLSLLGHCHGLSSSGSI